MMPELLLLLIMMMMMMMVMVMVVVLVCSARPDRRQDERVRRRVKD